MKILVACEESQAVTKQFRLLGHEAFSCDIIECSGDHPEWHIMQDVLPLLDGNCSFYTCDNAKHEIVGKWDMIIAFPPCTFLTVTGNRWFNVEKYGEKAIQRQKDREAAVEFFMKFANADCEKIAIENPIGVMSSEYRKPDQIIHPYGTVRRANNGRFTFHSSGSRGNPQNEHGLCSQITPRRIASIHEDWKIQMQESNA